MEISNLNKSDAASDAFNKVQMTKAPCDIMTKEKEQNDYFINRIQ